MYSHVTCDTFAATTFLKLGLRAGTFTRQPQIRSTDIRTDSPEDANPRILPILLKFHNMNSNNSKEEKKKREKLLVPLELSFYCASPKKKRDGRHNGQTKSILSPHCPRRCLSSLRASVSAPALFVPRCAERHGRIVSAAEEENGTVTVERIGS